MCRGFFSSRTCFLCFSLFGLVLFCVVIWGLCVVRFFVFFVLFRVLWSMCFCVFRVLHPLCVCVSCSSCVPCVPCYGTSCVFVFCRALHWVCVLFCAVCFITWAFLFFKVFTFCRSAGFVFFFRSSGGGVVRRAAFGGQGGSDDRLLQSDDEAIRGPKTHP